MFKYYYVDRIDEHEVGEMRKSIVRLAGKIQNKRLIWRSNYRDEYNIRKDIIV